MSTSGPYVNCIAVNPIINLVPNDDIPIINTTTNKLPRINISVQNVCSLNVSKPSHKTHSKIIAVTKSDSDIIFLCDTRLNSNRQIAGVNDIVKKFKFLGFTLHHNSTLNSRGVAILISNKLAHTIEDIFMDEECNILMLKIKVGNVTVTLGSVYGPNHDDENFFKILNDRIELLNSDFVITGGDWNTTYDSRNSRANIDTLNTVGIPSTHRSIWLNQLCTNQGLKDPYRYFYPETNEYTYVPFAAGATNRSRLDYFLISDNLLEQCVNCRIPHNLSTTLFDHKQVTLCFKRNNPYKKQTINDAILKDSDLLEIVNITAVDCYVNHVTPSVLVSDIEIDNMKLIIGRVCNLYRELVADRLLTAESGYDPEVGDRIMATKNAIKNNMELLPTLETLQTYSLSCSSDTFLEILIMSVKNSSLAHQHDFFKIKNAKKNNARKQIEAA
jgi:exonuclease III